MKLKYQLLLLALLSLLFPISGWFALKSVDKEFRLSLEQASNNTLVSLKASIQQLLTNDEKLDLHGFVAGNIEEFVLDGDTQEWNAIKAYVYHNNKQQLSLKLARNKRYLMLMIESNDASKNTNSANGTENDHIILALANDRGLFQYKIFRQAEGLLKPENQQNQPSYQAYWHEKSNGYALEIRFMNKNFHHLGLVSINNNGRKIITGTLQNNTASNLKLLPMVTESSDFKRALKNITPINNQLTISDADGRIIYQIDKLPSNQSVSAWQWMITPIYQWLFGINKQESNNKWFYRQADGMAGIQQVITEDGLRYQLKSMMPQGQQSMIQTLLKAGVLMIAVVLLLMLAYLGYSLILAWRIKKLNRALQSVLDDSGRLHIQMPSYMAGDEIGQLSRGIESMLGEMREYTQYLKDLGSRLSHEMKTPLAIVQSSLDNLEMEPSPEFLQRAQAGTKRLRFILNQLSELSQLKYTLEHTPKEKFDLCQLTAQLAQSYQSVIPQLKIRVPSEPMVIEGSKDLLAQMLDKLIDNAKDFIAADGTIELSVEERNGNVVLKVFNTDSQLPDKGVNIFDSLVSFRDKQDKINTHLGLGLYLVQLIARYHQAQLSAENTKEPQGVCFSIEFNKSTIL
jgi:signal transduction histidine kinase